MPEAWELKINIYRETMGMLSVCRTGRKNMGWEREKTNIFTQRAPLPNLPRTPQNMPHSNSRDS